MSDISNLGRSLLFRPGEVELRQLTAEMPSARETVFGNLNVQSQVGARQRSSTFIVTDEPEHFSEQTMRRDEAERLARLQDDYLAASALVAVDGYLGNGSPCRMSARLIVERDYGNIAAMQRLLYLDPITGDGHLDPELTVICTPGLRVEGYMNNRAIACWLDEGVTRVMNSDYFDETKKAGLRMWSSRVYESGGLVLHSGCKVIPSRRGLKSVLVLGLPDSGKSTITFTEHSGSRVVQDDFVALFEEGRIVSPQDGCIEKTYGLDPKLQPEIYAAATHPQAYMENVLQRGNLPDFSREADRRAGRAVFNLRLINSFAGEVPPLTTLLFLMRGEGVLPAVARLSRKEAVKHFLLRELRGWTAKDAHGEGSLPGPRADQSLIGIAQRGERLARLLSGLDFECYLVNTGSVGGPVSDSRSKSIPFSCSLGMVQALVDGTVEWDGAGDLGLDIAASAPPVDDIDLLQPRRLYESQGRGTEYRDLVDRTKLEWRANIGAVPQIGALSDVLASSSKGGRVSRPTR